MNLGDGAFPPEGPIPPGENAAIERVVRVSEMLLDRDAKPVIRRGQHPKHHGCVRAEFIVERDLPDAYRVGLFEEPKTYPAWIRFSNGGQQDDRKPDAHGMAIKLMDVPGEKILEEEKHETTHDFVMVDNPVFFLRNAIDYGVFSDALLKAKGKARSLVRSSLFFLPGKLRELGTLALLFFFPRRRREFSLLTRFVGKRITSPLETRYWSATPYQFGPGAAMKFSARPQVVNTAKPSGTLENYLRDAMVERLKNHDVDFEFQVQLQTDADSMPVEDPTVPWDEARSPFRTVARIRIPRRNSTARSRWPSARTCPTPPGTRSPSIAPWVESTGRGGRSIPPSRSCATSSTRPRGRSRRPPRRNIWPSPGRPSPRCSTMNWI